MTISNDLDSNISFLSRISSDGPTQPNQLNSLLPTTSQSCLVRVNHSVPLREFIETFLGYHPATQFPPVEHHTSKHDSLYLGDVEVAADWFKMNIDFYPENIDNRLKSDHFIIAMTFIVTIMLPIELVESRLIFLNSPMFERFNQSMQVLLKLQLISSYISIGQLPNAKIFLNKMVSRSNKLSNLPEFKALQGSLSNVQLESPVLEISPKSNNRRINSSPGIVDTFVDQVDDMKIEEDEIDTKPDLDYVQTPAQSSKNQIMIIDEDDTKPDLNHIRGPRRSSRKQHAILDDEKPLIHITSQRPKETSKKRRLTSDDEDASINITSNSLPNQNEFMESDENSCDSKPTGVVVKDEDLIDSKPTKELIIRAKMKKRVKKLHSSRDNNRPKLDDIISPMSELMEELQKSKGVAKDECKKMLKILDEKRYKIRAARATGKKSEVKESDFYMGTYRVFREWCAENQFSELPITFDKVFLWAELSLRSYAVHDLKMERRIRELDWFRGETISMGSDKTCFWPDSFWIKYFDEERFPHLSETERGHPRSTAYPRDNLDFNNSYPAPMPPQRERPQASS